MVSITAALRRALQGCSAEQLEHIGEHWAVPQLQVDGISGTEPERRLDEIISARFAWDALSPDARDILHSLIRFHAMDGVPRGDILALTSLSETAQVAALSELEQSLMLIETRPGTAARERLASRGQPKGRVCLVPDDFHALFKTIDAEVYEDYGDLSQMQLAELLATLDSSKLQVINTLATLQSHEYGIGFYRQSTNSQALAKTLAGRLVQANVVEAIWEQLNESERALCRWLCRADGEAEAIEAQSALNLSRAAFASTIYRLTNYGVVFDTFSGQTHKIFIPRGVFKVLRKAIGEFDQLEARIKNLAQEPVEQEATPPYLADEQDVLLYDLAIAVNAVYQTVIEPTQAGRVPKRIANKIAPLLHGKRFNYYEETDYYLDMLVAIASAVGILQEHEVLGQKARLVPGSKLDDWAHLTASSQALLLLEFWQKALVAGWSDVAGANYHTDDFGFGPYMEAQSSRQGLIAYIREHCQPGRWYRLESFLGTIKANHPQILRERSRYSSYGIGRNRKDLLRQWDHIDGEIIAGMLSSSLREMGLVTLGWMTDPSVRGEEGPRNPDAFRFTELAARVLWNIPPDEDKSGEEANARNVIVQPNFELLLLQPDYPTLYKLLPFTKVNQIEMVSRLILTQESVRRGVEAGLSVDSIIATLQACSQKELPQNVLYTLQDWGRLYKDATVSQTLLLEVSSEAVADEIFASSKFRALELRRLGPCALAIGGQVSLQVLRTTLEKEGIILRVQGNILTAREVAATSGYGRLR